MTMMQWAASMRTRSAKKALGEWVEKMINRANPCLARKNHAQLNITEKRPTLSMKAVSDRTSD
jgi:hypothetical protein